MKLKFIKQWEVPVTGFKTVYPDKPINNFSRWMRYVYGEINHKNKNGKVVSGECILKPIKAAK